MLWSVTQMYLQDWGTHFPGSGECWPLMATAESLSGNCPLWYNLPHPRFHSLPGLLLWFWATLKGHFSSRIPYRISCIWVQQMGFYFCTALLTTAKPLTLWITTNCGKFFKRWEYQTTWPASWEIGMQVKKQQLELDMEQQTSSKSGKKYVKAIYYHPAYLTYMQSTSCKMPG